MEHVYFLEAAMHGVAGSMNSMNSKNSDEGFFPGKRLPGTKYRVVRIIGEGGMAVAYECVKEPAGIRCVVKVLRRHLSADREQCVRFLREVSFLAELVHPHIVTVIDYDTLSTGAPFYAMELLTGKTLRAVLEEQGTLPPRVALKVMTQLLSALHCAHTHSTPLVHRDVKPDNVFIHTPRHGESTVKLLDFGVATVAHRAFSTRERPPLSIRIRLRRSPSVRRVKAGRAASPVRVPTATMARLVAPARSRTLMSCERLLSRTGHPAYQPWFTASLKACSILKSRQRV